MMLGERVARMRHFSYLGYEIEGGHESIDHDCVVRYPSGENAKAAVEEMIAKFKPDTAADALAMEWDDATGTGKLKEMSNQWGVSFTLNFEPQEVTVTVMATVRIPKGVDVQDVIKLLAPARSGYVFGPIFKSEWDEATQKGRVKWKVLKELKAFVVMNLERETE